MADENYICAMCGGEFEKGWSDDEAMAECESYFGNVTDMPLSIVCDDCYQIIHPAKHPAEVAKARI